MKRLAIQGQVQCLITILVYIFLILQLPVPTLALHVTQLCQTSYYNYWI